MKAHLQPPIKKKSLLTMRATQELTDLPRGLELVNDLEFSILRLRKAGAQKDALRLHILEQIDLM